MGFAIMYAQCCSCHVVIAFNPHAVPSLMINGKREPLCRNCAERWNELHPNVAKLIREDAYEAIPEEEL